MYKSTRAGSNSNYWVQSSSCPIWKSWFMRSLWKKPWCRCWCCELMCVSKISTFHLDKKCVAIYYLLRWPPLPNDPKCVTQYFETRLYILETDQNRKSSDADLFMEHCQKNVPITHVDCLVPHGIFTRADQNCPIVKLSS